MLTAVIQRHEQLRRELDELVRTDGRARATGLGAVAHGPLVDVVVTANEMNDKHGTGPLVRRIFEGCPNILSIRARNHYGGEHDFGAEAVLLSQEGVPRAQAFVNVLRALDGRRVRRIVCVPYFADDLLTSIALKELFDAPLCCYVMDDQNIAVKGIPDPLMREFLSKCSLRFATHPELRAAYQAKFGLEFFLLPAVVPGDLVYTGAEVPCSPELASRTGALVGSIWSQRWLDLLCHTVSGSGHALDWYGNNKSPVVRIQDEQLAHARIHARGIVPEPRLAALLRDYPYAVVPTGTIGDETGNARALAQLSLPGRILFIASTSNTPVIILGSEQTSAARFVTRFDIGVISDYSPEGFRRAVDRVMIPSAQQRMRRNAAALGPVLSSKDMGAWVWRSLELGRPSDDRFEALLPRQATDLVELGDAPAPVTSAA
jgi:hypothetical protein